MKRWIGPAAVAGLLLAGCSSEDTPAAAACRQFGEQRAAVKAATDAYSAHSISAEDLLAANRNMADFLTSKKPTVAGTPIGRQWASYAEAYLPTGSLDKNAIALSGSALADLVSACDNQGVKT